MIVKSGHTLKDGRLRLVVELAANETAVGILHESYYRLGDPLRDEVVRGDMLVDAIRVVWCPVEQKRVRP